MRLPSAYILTRAGLAGPGAFASALAVCGLAVVWMPPGAGGINQLTIPAVAFPLIWVGLMLYALLEPRTPWVAGVIGGLILGPAAVIALTLVAAGTTP